MKAGYEIIVADNLYNSCEEALNGATDKFIGRFRKVEEEAARQGRALEGMSLAELDKLWEHAKET